jgi:hypothetical protein
MGNARPRIGSCRTEEIENEEEASCDEEGEVGTPYFVMRTYRVK